MDSSKYLNQEELTSLEACLLRSLGKDKRNAVMLLVALYTGTRANELLGIQWRDIEFKTGEIFISTLKGGRNRTVCVPTSILDHLATIDRNKHESPFDIGYQRLVDIWNEYRPSRKPLRSLRHSFAMKAMSKSNDIRFVQRVLGHRSIANTMIYLEYDYSPDQYKKIMGIK
jgi:integrase